jgi:glycosyltransferase involved in cell wall biosynthesis
MDIVYLAHFAGSPAHGMVHAYYHLAQEWIKLGHSVTIVAASFAHPRGYQPEVSGRLTEQWIAGIRYLWVPTNSYKPESYIGRATNIIQFVAKTWFTRLPINHADIVICSSHHPFAIFPAKRIAKKFNARLIFEVRDLWPLSLIEIGRLSRFNPFIWLMQRAENYAYRKSDHVVSVLSGSKPYMVGHGMSEARFSFIPNGVVIPENNEIAALPEEHQQLLDHEGQHQRDGQFWLGFAGRLNNAVALHHLIKAIYMAKHSNIKLFLLGNGERRKSLQSLVDDLQLKDKVFFLDIVSTDMVASFLGQMDALYLGLQRQSLFRFGVSPTKLNDYMLAAKPIIYAIDAPNDPVLESGCGISCQPESAEDIAKAIDTMMDMPAAELEDMGRRGYAWLVENRDYRILAKRFLEEVMV